MRKLQLHLVLQEATNRGLTMLFSGVFGKLVMQSCSTGVHYMHTHSLTRSHTHSADYVGRDYFMARFCLHLNNVCIRSPPCSTAVWSAQCHLIHSSESHAKKCYSSSSRKKKTSDILVIVGSLLEVAASGQINEQNWDLYTRDIIDEGRMKKKTFWSSLLNDKHVFSFRWPGPIRRQNKLFWWLNAKLHGKKKTADRNQSGYKKIAAFNNTGWGKNKRREFERLTLIKPMVLLWDHPQLFWRPVASKKLPWRLDIPLTPLMLIKDSVMLSKPYFRDQEMLQE